jgi:hypothetical protein
MKRRLGAVAVATALVGGVLASPASADPGVGRPGSPSCWGQAISYYAQAFGGIANAADAYGVTIQHGHNLVRANCGRTSGYVPAS